jgi:FkbM family methyltransferase
MTKPIHKAPRTLALVKQLIPENSRLRAWFRRARRGAPASIGERIIREFAKAYPKALFIQIGSNDGDHIDPLRAMVLQYRWRGIMVEPVPYVFARLQSNYAPHAKRVRLENVAIADCNGTLPFYHLAQVDNYEREGLPFWYDQLGSFKKEVILGHAHTIPDIAKRLVTSEVSCITFDALCQRNGVEHIDLLHTDTEGYDFTLLKLIDLARHRPRVLIYEHQHLSAKDRAACIAYLAQFGYIGFSEGMDTWCLNINASSRRDHRLLQIWRELTPNK